VSDSFSNALNNVASSSTIQRQYDANGNLTSTSLPQNLSYDYRNQLVQFIGGGQTATYRYDCFGRRIQKTVNGVITRFYYAGLQLIEEQTSGNTTVATYVYSKGRDSLLQMARGGQTYFYHEDDMGSLIMMSDTNANVIEQYKYGDFGAPWFLDHLGNPITQS